MTIERDDWRLSAYVVDELSREERLELEREMQADEGLQREVAELEDTAKELREAFGEEACAALLPHQRGAISKGIAKARQPRRVWKRLLVSAAAAGFLGVAGVGVLAWLAERSGEGAGSFGYMVFGDGATASAPPRASRDLGALGYAGDSGGMNPTALGELPEDALDQMRALGYSGGGPASPGPAGPSGSRVGPRTYTWRDTSQIAPPTASRESYSHIQENAFKRVLDEPLSTFSIDVDTASYANVRRFLVQGQRPPADAVRIEELVNYFAYEDPAPTGREPFATTIEVASAPWQPRHRLVRIGLQGRPIADLPARPKNLVFLIDVSGSMNSADKLPLLKRSMRMLVEELEGNDRVSVVVYAGASGVALPATSIEHRARILQAIDELTPGGSTNGAGGIELAYEIAAEEFLDGGINRVVLATDGDFNVGISDEGSLVRLIEEKAASGVFLSVLGFGTGNLQDSKMEQLADHGNGNYAYIDSVYEAHKVLVREIGGTLETIAKDVKVQVEFNPAEVEAFRLIGYENRLLAHADFNDDEKDAGEIGAGHSVVALYEVVPAGTELEVSGVDPLKYQSVAAERGVGAGDGSGELLTVKLRYKEPEGSKSRLLEFPLRDSNASFAEGSANLRFAAAVAGFGMLLRNSRFKGDADWSAVREWAAEAVGADPHGDRLEFVRLVEKAGILYR